MTDLTPPDRLAHVPAITIDDSSAGAGKQEATEEWDSGPLRKLPAALPPCEPLAGLSPDEMNAAYLRLINQLLEKGHPLALSYLSDAGALAGDNPHRDRLVNMGCKLVSSANQLMATTARLNKGN